MPKACVQASVGIAALTAALALVGPAAAGAPLPKPRPAEAPRSAPADAAVQDGEGQKTEGGSAAEAPAVSACRKALTEERAIAPSIPDIKGPGACGGSDLVRLEAVVLPDGGRVAVSPAAVLRCAMAAELVEWIRTDVAQLAQSMQTQVTTLDNFDSFECRGRNRVAGAKLSEHGKANAIDVRELRFANGQTLNLTDRAAPRALREKLLGSACSRFSTVLGPGSDWYHEDHVHLDLAERRSGYRICQWAVWDPLPVVAPLLPAERPAEAPPRAVAQNDAAGEGGEPEAAADAQMPAAPAPQPSVKRKKRR